MSVMLMHRVGKEWLPVAWLGVAQRSRCGADLWRAMHRPMPPLPAPKTNPDRQPVTPWLATRLLPGALVCGLEAMGWIADFSECLAWEWILETGE